MDLKIKDVAELLNISPTTVRRWLGDGKIPAYKLNGQYRFSRSEIEDWVMQQKLGFQDALQKQGWVKEDPVGEEDDLTAPSGNRQFSLYRALYRGDAITLPGKNKEELFASAMKHMAKLYDLDADVLTELFLDRENLMPTTLGLGIGVPHTRDFLLNTHFDVILLVYPETPIEYGALDGQPVNLLFFLFACEDKQHLHLLAKLAHLASSEKARAFLSTKPPKEKLLTYIKQWESTLNTNS